MGLDKQEEEAVLRVMRSGVLSGYQGNVNGMYGGEEIQALEKEWAEFYGVKHAIAVNSATSGLWCALSATIGNNLYGDNSWDCGTETEVIVTPYSMTCSASLPLLFSANPIFADIEPDYFCLSPESVEEKITIDTKAIIVVDLFGQPYDADAINEIAERKGKEYGHKIYVIEDAAQSPYSKYKGKFAGTLGDIGVYSLNFHKHIHCGEGGIVVTDDDELNFKIRLGMNHAEAVLNDMKLKSNDITSSLTQMVGMNLRMTELQGCIARVQLSKLKDIMKVYIDDAKYFPVKVRPDCEHSYYRYAYMEKDEADTRGSCFNYKNHYITPIYKMPLFQHLGYPQDLCPVCEEVDKNIVLAWHKNTP